MGLASPGLFSPETGQSCCHWSPGMNVRSATSPVLSNESLAEHVEAPAVEPSPGKRHGIAIVANDKIADWLLPFLESYHATNAATPLFLIPYDDNLTITRRRSEEHTSELQSRQYLVC